MIPDQKRSTLAPLKEENSPYNLPQTAGDGAQLTSYSLISFKMWTPPHVGLTVVLQKNTLKCKWISTLFEWDNSL